VNWPDRLTDAKRQHYIASAIIALLKHSKTKLHEAFRFATDSILNSSDREGLGLASTLLYLISEERAAGGRLTKTRRAPSSARAKGKTTW